MHSDDFSKFHVDLERMGRPCSQEAQIIPEVNSSKVWTGHVIRIAATFGSRKLKSDSANEASDERVVEVVISADNTPFLIGQRVMVKFMKAKTT